MESYSKISIWIIVGSLLLQNFIALFINSVWHPALQLNPAMSLWLWKCVHLSIASFFGASKSVALFRALEMRYRPDILAAPIAFAFHVWALLMSPERLIG